MCSDDMTWRAAPCSSATTSIDLQAGSGRSGVESGNGDLALGVDSSRAATNTKATTLPLFRIKPTQSPLLLHLPIGPVSTLSQHTTSFATSQTSPHNVTMATRGTFNTKSPTVKRISK